VAGWKAKLGEGRTGFVQMGLARLHRALDDKSKSPDGAVDAPSEPIITLPICWMAHRIVLKMFEELDLQII
jgi:hypothetical protein